MIIGSQHENMQLVVANWELLINRYSSIIKKSQPSTHDEAEKLRSNEKTRLGKPAQALLETAPRQQRWQAPPP